MTPLMIRIKFIRHRDKPPVMVEVRQIPTTGDLITLSDEGPTYTVQTVTHHLVRGGHTATLRVA